MAALADEGAPIPFAVARAFRMWFGKHMGQQIDKIAETDEGLLYLDWLRGDIEGAAQRTTRQQVVLDHLQAYLDDATIGIAVARALRKRGAWREG